MKRKHILMMVSIAILSFLIGTLFSTGFAQENERNPINQILDRLTELESEVAQLEEVPTAVQYLSDQTDMHYDELEGQAHIIEDKMGIGLVGEFYEGSVTTIPGDKVTLFEYRPGGKPKKLSVYVNIDDMDIYDTIRINIVYSIRGAPVELDDQEAYNDEITKTLDYVFSGLHFIPGKLVVDQLPIATYTQVKLDHYDGDDPIRIDYQAIIEEV